MDFIGRHTLIAKERKCKYSFQLHEIGLKYKGFKHLCRFRRIYFRSNSPMTSRISDYIKDQKIFLFFSWFANAIFQMTEARTTFPCYDEPERKAHFNIKIFHSPDYHAISNTEVTDITEQNF